MLTVSLITLIFYFHPSTSTAALYFRTVPILPEITGRVAEVHDDYSAPVSQGRVIFRLDSSKQEAALRRPGEDRRSRCLQLVAAKADI